MILFGKHYFYLQLIGLNPQGERRDIIRRTIVSVTFVSLIIMTLTSLLLNLHQKFNVVLLVVQIFFGYGAIIAEYFSLLLNRKYLSALSGELGEIVLESRWRFFCIFSTRI